MKRGKLPLICTAVLALALVIAGCASPQVELATTLNIRLSGEPPGLDPALVFDTRSGAVTMSLFLGLSGIRDISYELTPRLATAWDVSDDGLVWTFHLRDDVCWVHYDPQTQAAEKKRKVTAHDVEYAIKRTIDPATGCPYANMDYVIQNAYAVNTGDESVSLDSVGVAALDDHTVQFTLEHPAGYFPNIAGLWTNFPLPREVIDQFGDVWTEPGNLWTCGPFMLAAWEHDARILLVKNPHYYDAQNVAIETVNYVMLEAASTVFQMYQAGEVDTCDIPPADLEWVRAHPELSKELHVASSLGSGYMMFNVSKPPTDNALVRKALYFEAEKILCQDEAIMIPMWFSVSMFLTKPYVERDYNPLGAGLASWRVRAH
jgi:oligopeptide transport system substrate-binding protein